MRRLKLIFNFKIFLFRSETSCPCKVCSEGLREMSLLPEVIKLIFTVSESYSQFCHYRIEALCECSDEDKKGEPRCVFRFYEINKVLTKTHCFLSC